MDANDGDNRGTKKTFPRGGALIFAVLRLAGLFGLLAAIVVAFVGSIEFSALGGLSPDGPPSGFGPISALVFSVVFTPVMLFAMAKAFPWLALPCLLLAAVDIAWRLQPIHKREKVNDFLRRHTILFFLLLIMGSISWAWSWHYAYRSGSARFSIQNGSGQILDHVEWQAQSGKIEVGRMLPWERRYFEFTPKSASELVRLRFQAADGTVSVLDYGLRIENSRKYYVEFGVDENLHATSGAWELDSSASSHVQVINGSNQILSNVELNGLGWRVAVPTLAPNDTMEGDVRPQGPMIYAIAYEAGGQRRAYELWKGWGYEGRTVTVRIPADLKFHPLGKP